MPKNRIRRNRVRGEDALVAVRDHLDPVQARKGVEQVASCALPEHQHHVHGGVGIVEGAEQARTHSIELAGTALLLERLGGVRDVGVHGAPTVPTLRSQERDDAPHPPAVQREPPLGPLDDVGAAAPEQHRQPHPGEDQPTGPDGTAGLADQRSWPGPHPDRFGDGRGVPGRKHGPECHSRLPRGELRFPAGDELDVVALGGVGVGHLQGELVQPAAGTELDDGDLHGAELVVTSA